MHKGWEENKKKLAKTTEITKTRFCKNERKCMKVELKSLAHFAVSRRERREKHSIDLSHSCTPSLTNAHIIQTNTHMHTQNHCS